MSGRNSTEPENLRCYHALLERHAEERLSVETDYGLLAAASRSIGEVLRDGERPHTVVMKSTASPVGNSKVNW